MKIAAIPATWPSVWWNSGSRWEGFTSIRKKKIPIGTAMDDVEREVILRTLEAHDGNKTVTAEVLGISRRSIYNKLAIYGLDDDGKASPSPARE